MHRALLPFYRQFNRSTGGFAQNLHCWTLNHQHVYVKLRTEANIANVSINYRFVAVRSNYTSVTPQRKEAFQNTASARI